MTNFENAAATVLAALIGLVGIVLGIRAAQRSSKASDDTTRQEAKVSDQARFLDSVLSEVTAMRTEAQAAISRLDAISKELDLSRRDNLDCIRERDLLKGRVATLEERNEGLEKRLAVLEKTHRRD